MNKVGPLEFRELVGELEHDLGIIYADILKKIDEKDECEDESCFYDIDATFGPGNYSPQINRIQCRRRGDIWTIYLMVDTDYYQRAVLSQTNIRVGQLVGYHRFEWSIIPECQPIIIRIVE